MLGDVYSYFHKKVIVDRFKLKVIVWILMCVNGYYVETGEKSDMFHKKIYGILQMIHWLGLINMEIQIISQFHGVFGLIILLLINLCF